MAILQGIVACLGQALLVSSTSTRSRELCAPCCWRFCLYMAQTRRLLCRLQIAKNKKNAHTKISCVLGKVAQFTFIFRLFLRSVAVRLSCDCRPWPQPVPCPFCCCCCCSSCLPCINSTTKAAICFHLSVWMQWTRRARPAKNLIRPVLVCCQRSRNHSSRSTWGMPHAHIHILLPSCLRHVVYAAIKFNCNQNSARKFRL